MTRDETIGAQLAHHRGTMSQADLARSMKDLGWNWSQSTVWSIEKGKRPLRLAEAQDLLPLLDLVNVDQLLGSSWDVELSSQLQRVRSARESAIRAIHAYNHARLDLAFVADDELLNGRQRNQMGEIAREVAMGPFELAERYESWAVDPDEGDRALRIGESNPTWDPESKAIEPFLDLFFQTSGYRGQRRQAP